ncbi:hypothetical protein [Candidatus Palauibacter sp.]|uniref:hypothetical protein n=1 Tax=Candidatus Palauibacter sp. TaxID=3101350 RepID=UPI003B019068
MRKPRVLTGVLRAPKPIDAAGLGCTLAYGVLSWSARQSGEPPLLLFLGVAVWAALLTFGLYAYHRRHPTEPFPVGRLIGWAVVFRLCGLIGGPIYEDDFYRYLWDAYRFAQDGTPYGVPPEAFFADPGVTPRFQRILDQVNYPELPTIYGPVTQLFFLMAYALSPGSIAALQGPLILVDLLAIGLLLRLAPARAVLLYAWCPLVVKEIAFTAHPDGAAVCLLLAAVVLARRDRLRGAAVCLALAAGAKVLALLLVPFVLARARPVDWGVFAGVLALLYLPFVLQGGTDLATLVVFAREWEFNAALFGFLKPWMSGPAARAVCGLALAGGVAWYYGVYRRSASGAVPRGDWIYGGLLALWPVVNPWYLLWLLPFAAIRPSAWAWTASVAVLLAYMTGLNLNDLQMEPFGHPLWVRPVEYGLILLAMVYDVFRRARRNTDGSAPEWAEGR